MATPQVTCKADVTLLPRPAAGAVIDAAIVLASGATGLPILITSGTEAHAPGDPHSRGCARDIGVIGWSVEQILQVMRAIELGLHQLVPSIPWTVLYENAVASPDPRLAPPVGFVNPQATGPHLHIQPGIGAPWPPVMRV